MEPITEDLSLCKQNMFFIEMESENCISTELLIEKIILIGWQTITILRDTHLQAQLSDSDFCHIV